MLARPSSAGHASTVFTWSRIQLPAARIPERMRFLFPDQANGRGLVLLDPGEAPDAGIQEEIVARVIVRGRDLADDAFRGRGPEHVPGPRHQCDPGSRGERQVLARG